MAAQHGDVRAQTRQGCPQLVTCVLHEALLLGPGPRQRAEHAGERAAEHPDLVAAAADRDRDVEPSGRLDFGSCASQAPERGGDRSGDQRADRSRREGHHDDQHGRAPAEIVEDGVDLVQRASDLDRTGRRGVRVDPDVAGVGRERLAEYAAGGSGELARGVAHRDVERELAADRSPAAVELAHLVDLEHSTWRNSVAPRARGDAERHLVDRAVDLVDQPDGAVER